MGELEAESLVDKIFKGRIETLDEFKKVFIGGELTVPKVLTQAIRLLSKTVDHDYRLIHFLLTYRDTTIGHLMKRLDFKGLQASIHVRYNCALRFQKSKLITL